MLSSVLRLLSQSGVSAIALSVVAFTLVSSDASSSLTRRQAIRIEVKGSGLVSTESVRCRSVCRLRVRSGSLLRLAASPGEHFDSVVWTSGCVGSALSCVVVADRSGTVRAEFQRKLDRFTVSVGGPGVLTSAPAGLLCGESHLTCSAEFPEAVPVTLQVFPDAPTDKVLWDNNACAGNTSCTLVVQPRGSAVVAVQVPGSPTSVGNRALHVTNNAGGIVTSDPPGIRCNVETPLTCTALFRWHSLVRLSGGNKWADDCVGESARCWLFLDGDSVANVTARPISIPQLTSVSLILSVAPHSHGVVVGRVEGSSRQFRCGYQAKAGCNPDFNVRSVVVLKGQPARSFGGWAGFCQGRKPCRLQMGKTKVVLAYFKKR
jgi:hypothetical protein